MRALSIRQPWAWLIAAGVKTVENRTWATSYRGPLLIHAGQSLAMSPDDLTRMRKAMAGVGVIMPAQFDRGGIVGVVDVVDIATECADPADADWHEPGCYAWILRNPRSLPFLATPGRLMLFEVEYPLADHVVTPALPITASRRSAAARSGGAAADDFGDALTRVYHVTPDEQPKAGLAFPKR